jgi:GNAT superfamily N-acetyltransferase
MVKDLVLAPVDPNSASADFWRRYHEFRRDRHAETRPEDPILPDDVEETIMRSDRRFEIFYRHEIARNGEMVSWFGCSTIKPGAPGYEANRHLMSADIAVRRDHRRRGIGRSWLPLLLELMDRHGCTVLTLDTHEESGHAFLQWLGAEPKFDDVENRLQLADVDWAMVARWVAEGEARSPRTRLELYDGRLPEAMLEEYSAQLSAGLNSAPTEQLDNGETVVTPEQVREWYERWESVQEVSHIVMAREPDGSLSGLTEVSWCAHTPQVVHQQFTGVRPAARGRGIGKWIKAAMLQHVRELHPEARWVSTYNAGSNEPMLAINHQLGFRLYRAGKAYQMTRDQLAARVGALGGLRRSGRAGSCAPAG